MSIPHNSTHANQVITYLKNGVTPIEISRALGITPGAVTQLMQSPEVSAEIGKLQAEQQKRSSAIDAKYDAIEDKLLTQLERTIPLLMRPGEIANVLSRINAAKRRGVAHQIQSGPAQVLQLNLPVAIQNKFVVNAANQVVQAGEQTLVTIQASNVPGLAQRLVAPEGVNHDPVNTTNQEEDDEFGFPIER